MDRFSAASLRTRSKGYGPNEGYFSLYQLLKNLKDLKHQPQTVMAHSTGVFGEVLQDMASPLLCGFAAIPHALP